MKEGVKTMQLFHMMKLLHVGPFDNDVLKFTLILLRLFSAWQYAYVINSIQRNYNPQGMIIFLYEVKQGGFFFLYS